MKSHRFPRAILAIALAWVAAPGCGGGNDTTVIQPTESYQLTEQEAENRQRAQRELSQQRQ